MEEQRGQPSESTRKISRAEPQYVREGLIKRYWQRFINVGGDRQVELILAFAITFFSALQWITSCTNNAGTTKQTAQLIKAANINACAAQKIADASKRNANAAVSFATSAGNINTAMGKAVIELDRQAKIADRTRQDSATANQKSLDATRDNFREDQRAWVGVLDYEVTHFVKGEPIEFKIRLQNTGKTPALNFSVNAVGDFLGNEGPTHQWIKNGLDKVRPRGSSVIAPQEVQIIRNEYARVLTETDEQAVKTGKATYYIVGRATYIGVDLQPEWMTFCIDFSTTSPTINPAPSVRLCEVGNDMSYHKTNKTTSTALAR
jgi:hypothetical protein